MKKIIVSALVLLMSVTAFSQAKSGTWNKATATYSNAKYGVTWKLLEGLEWVGRPILTDDTLLKVRNDDSQILVTLSASLVDNKGEDIWDFVFQYNSEEFKAPVRELAKHNGMTLQYVKPIRSQLCGKHAVKIKTDMTKYHPEYDVTVHAVEYNYQVVSGNSFLTLCVTGMSVLESELEDFDLIVRALFDGVSIK